MKRKTEKEKKRRRKKKKKKKRRREKVIKKRPLFRSDNNRKDKRQGGGQWVAFAVTGTARWSGSLTSTLVVCSQGNQRHETPEIRPVIVDLSANSQDFIW